MSTSADRDARFAWPLACAWWSAVGVAVGAGLVGLITIGLIFLIAALVMTIPSLWSARLRNRSAFMVLSGAAAGPLLLAWINKGGPGRVCRVEGAVTTCSDRASPWPFLVAAVLLVATGAFLAHHDRRAVPFRSSPPDT